MCGSAAWTVSYGEVVTGIGDVSLPVYIVVFRKIVAVVRTAAFLTPERRSRDQSRDGDKVELLPRIGVVSGRTGERVAMCRIRRLALGHRRPESLARAEQADRSPHQIAH